MTEAKHTPGPWRTFNVTDVYPDDGGRIGVKHIADCAMSGAMGAEEIAANARLIAAAPDLLNALRWYEDATEAEFKNDRGKRARSAIAKATAT